MSLQTGAKRRCETCCNVGASVEERRFSAASEGEKKRNSILPKAVAAEQSSQATPNKFTGSGVKHHYRFIRSARHEPVFDENRVMSENESVILKPRELLSDAILTQNADELAKFMDQPTTAIAEAMTALLAAGPKAWIGIIGRLVQATLKAKLFPQISQEIKDLREKGKIPDDYADEKKYKYGFKSWVELLAFIDEETPDADRLEAVKAMFYGVNKINATDGERILNYQLLQIAKKLTSGELLLLRAIFEACQNSDFGTGSTMPLTQWAAK
jgi:hypothetical protein